MDVLFDIIAAVERREVAAVDGRVQGVGGRRGLA